MTDSLMLVDMDGSALYALISNAVMDYNGQPATLITVADTATDTKTRIELEQANRELAISYGDSNFSALANSDSKTSIKQASSFSPQYTLPTYFEKEPLFFCTLRDTRCGRGEEFCCVV